MFKLLILVFLLIWASPLEDLGKLMYRNMHITRIKICPTITQLDQYIVCALF